MKNSFYSFLVAANILIPVLTTNAFAQSPALNQNLNGPVILQTSTGMAGQKSGIVKKEDDAFNAKAVRDFKRDLRKSQMKNGIKYLRELLLTFIGTIMSTGFFTTKKDDGNPPGKPILKRIYQRISDTGSKVIITIMQLTWYRK